MFCDVSCNTDNFCYLFIFNLRLLQLEPVFQLFTYKFHVFFIIRYFLIIQIYFSAGYQPYTCFVGRMSLMNQHLNHIQCGGDCKHKQAIKKIVMCNIMIYFPYRDDDIKFVISVYHHMCAHDHFI